MKIALYNWNSVLDEVIVKMQDKHTLLKSYEDADVVVLWNEIKEADWQKRVTESQEMGKKVILYQHGVWGTDRTREPFNEPILSDIVTVWGEGDKKRLIQDGIPEEKIVITGCPLFQRLKPRIPHDGKNVVFALEHWDWGDVIENNIVARKLRDLKGAKIITKGLKRENKTDSFENPVSSYRLDYGHLDIVAEVLSTADLVVAISESTFAFLAEYLDIPVIIADVWTPKPRAGDETYLKFQGLYSNAITKVKLEDLNKEIMYQLKHPEILREERKQAVLENGGSNIKDPVQNIIDVIENE